MIIIATRAVTINDAMKGLPKAPFSMGLCPTQLAAELTAAPMSKLFDDCVDITECSTDLKYI